MSRAVLVIAGKRGHGSAWPGPPMTFADALARSRRAYQRGRDGGEHHPDREPITRTPAEEASETLGLYHRLLAGVALDEPAD